MKRLTIVNSMLASIGQLPVNSLESTHPFAITAINTLEGVDREVQSKGYWFNTDRKVTLTPNSQSEIPLPSTILSVDPVDRKAPYLQRGGKLYDPQTLSSKFTAPVVVNMVSLIDLEDLPHHAANYIKRRAVMEFFLDLDGEMNKYSELEKLAGMALQALNTEQLKVVRTDIEDNPQYNMLMSRSRGRYSGLSRRF